MDDLKPFRPSGHHFNVKTTNTPSASRSAAPAGRGLLLGVAMILGVASCRPATSQARPPDAGKADRPEGKATKMTTVLSKSGYDVTPLPKEEVARLAAKLDPEAYRITQKAGTEPAFCGNLLDNKKEGVYTCVVCGLPLFSSENKFHSGTGWPSFYREVDPAHVTRKTDVSYGMARVEINCARCGAHLGHLFPDGPEPTGLRYCINSVCLKLEEGK